VQLLFDENDFNFALDEIQSRFDLLRENFYETWQTPRRILAQLARLTLVHVPTLIPLEHHWPNMLISLRGQKRKMDWKIKTWNKFASRNARAVTDDHESRREI
jgi:hypothetical protein